MYFNKIYLLYWFPPPKEQDSLIKYIFVLFFYFINLYFYRY